MADTKVETIVAIAAPITPVLNPAIRIMSSKTFTTPEIIKNQSEAVLFPTALKILAKRLYANVPIIPAHMTIIYV